MLQAFVLNVSVVFPDVRYKCFTHMLHVFYLDVAYIFNGFFKCFHVFLQVFQTYVASVLTVFERMLQTFHLDVSKVDWVLHLPPRLLLPHLVSPPLLDAGDVRATWVGASHSSSAESERVGRAEQSKCGAWGAASGRGPRARCLDASCSD
jgi:hypothetical protein